MKIPSTLIAAWLLLPLVMALPAADTNKMVSVDLGHGKVVEMPDTSDAANGLDLSRLKLELLYAVDFSKPLKFFRETDLFSGGQRTHLPGDVDWVLEGKATARAEDGRLILKNDPGHLTFWNTREFPSNVLIQFDVSPADSNKGLNIVFFAARGRDGGAFLRWTSRCATGCSKTTLAARSIVITHLIGRAIPKGRRAAPRTSARTSVPILWRWGATLSAGMVPARIGCASLS